MDNKELKDFLNLKQSNIDWTIDNILKRGYEEVIQEVDDYSLLLEKNEFRNVIIFELYENFFLPQRHEFELQILTDIVEAIVESKTLSYVAGVTISGTVYDLLKKLLSHVSTKFKDKDERRSKLFSIIENDVNKIEKYFEIHESGKIDELEKCLDVDRDRLVPLLKLLGFKRYRGKKKHLWVRPD